jgi:hypothetical protein
MTREEIVAIARHAALASPKPRKGSEMALQDRADIQAYARQRIEELLGDCTPQQVQFFRRLYPQPVPVRKINAALQLIERTIRANKKGE